LREPVVVVTINLPVTLTMRLDTHRRLVWYDCVVAPAGTPSRIGKRRDPPPRTLFVFLAGVEGTGHHFYKTLFKEHSSKLRDIIGEKLHAVKSKMMHLQASLYNDIRPERALFTGALAYKKKNVHADGSKIFQSIVAQLKDVNTKVLRYLAHDDDDRRQEKGLADAATAGTFPIPLNAIFANHPYGMISYPNYLEPSRPLQYPDLPLLYRACDAANVSCGHVYLHRDAYGVMGMLL
jgi:hypothetical protein